MPEISKTSKTDLLKIEKRVIDLELAVTELKEGIQSIDVSMIPELKEKVEDLEDLIMVEQAGILELKKLLEESKPEKPAIPEDLETRLKSVESSIPNLVEKTELESKLENMQKDISSLTGKPVSVETESLYSRFTQLENNLSALKSQTDSIIKDLYERIKEISAKTMEFKQPTIDFDLLASRVEVEKESIDELSKKKLELDLKLTEMGRKIDILENKMRGTSDQQTMEGLKSNRKEIATTNVRIDSLERVARELMGNVQNLERSMKKFESLERVSLLSKDIEDKIERFKFIEDETRRLSSRVELIYDTIDRRLEKIKDIERGFPELAETVSKLSQEIDKNKIEVLEKTKQEISDRTEGLRSFSKQAESLERKMKELKAGEINRILTDVTTKIAVIESKLSLMETDYRKKIEEFASAAREKIVEVKAPSFLDEQIKELVNRIVFLESRLMGIESMMREKREALPIIIE